MMTSYNKKMVVIVAQSLGALLIETFPAFLSQEAIVFAETDGLAGSSMLELTNGNGPSSVTLITITNKGGHYMCLTEIVLCCQ